MKMVTQTVFLFISRGDYSENDALYFHLLKITNTVPDGISQLIIMILKF